MIDDQYAPPTAELEAEPRRARRPGLVWVICLFYGYSALSSLIFLPLIMLDAIPLPEAQRELIGAIGPVQAIFNLGNALVLLAFSVQLFRLRKSAVPLCACVIAVSTLGWASQLLFGPARPAEIPMALSIGSALIGLGIAVAIYFYCRRLQERSILT